MKIVADDKIPFLRGVLEPFARVDYMPGKEITRDVVMDADALLVRTRTKCDHALLEGTAVRFIGTATIGYDHIDTGFCDSNNIKWVNAPGCNSSSVQQYIAAALLKISSDNGMTLKDKTLGIVGVGNVGSKIERFARVMGMRVLLNDPPRERNEGRNHFCDLEQILDESDIVTLHVPLNMEGADRTWHLINRQTLGRLRKGAWLINTSRGEVADTEALKEALISEHLGGTVLDVWENEPELDIPLMHMSYLATPHIAGYSTDGKANGTTIAVWALSAFFDLPLANWSPAEIPPPQQPELSIDCNGKGSEEIIRKAVLHSYNIVEDDIKLRFDPSRFEKIRGDYPLRREFPAFRLNLKDATTEARKMLEGLGFRVAGQNNHTAAG